MADVTEKINFEAEFDSEKAISDAQKLDKVIQRLNNTVENLNRVLDTRAHRGSLPEMSKSFASARADLLKLSELMKSMPSVASSLGLTPDVMSQLKNVVDEAEADFKRLRAAQSESVSPVRADPIDVDRAVAEQYARLPEASRQALEARQREVAVINKLRTAIEAYRQKQQMATEAARRNQEVLRSTTVTSLSNEMNSLKTETESVGNEFEQMFKTGDFTNLRSASEKLRELNTRAQQLRANLASAQTQGIDTSGYETELAQVESQLGTIATETSSQLRTRTTSALKDAFSKAYSFAKTAFNGAYGVAKKLTTSWGRLLGKTFKTVTSSWAKILTGIFSTSGKGSNTLANQIKALLGYASLAGLVRLGKEALELSSSMVEVQNVIDNVFEEATDDINAFCDTAIEKFGLTALEARNMTGVFGGILTSSGIVGNAKAEMSKNLTALAGDVASFYNMDTAAVFKKLQSGLTGNVAAMRTFGVSMTVANLEAYALEQGITKSYKAMNQAEKITLRYNYMLRQLAVAQGDYSRTSMTWANQTRLLANNFKQLLSILGGALVKTLLPTVQILNQIVVAAINAANALAKIFGFSAEDLSGMFGGGGASEDWATYADATEEVADSLDDVGKSAKNAGDNLQSFDKLNNISTPSIADTSETADLLGSSLLEFDSYYENIEDAKVETNERLQKILDTIKDFAKDVASVDYSAFKDAWDELGDSIEDSVDIAGDAIVWLWKSVLFPFYKWGMEQGAPETLLLIAAGVDALNEILKAVAPEVDEFWDDTMSPFFDRKGDEFVDTVRNWRKELEKFTDDLSKAPDKIKFLKDTVKKIKDEFYEWVGDKKITDRLDSIGESLESIVSKLFDGSTSKQAASLLRSFTKISLIVFDNLIGLVDWAVGNEKVTDFVEFLIDNFGELTDYSFDAIKEILDYIAESEDARELVVDLKELIKTIIDYIVDNKEEILGTIGGLVSVLETVFGWLSDCGIGVDDLFTAFIVFKGIETTVGLLTWLGSVKQMLTILGASSGAGSVGSVATALSGLGSALPAIGGVAAVLGVTNEAGKAAYEHTKAVADAEKEFDDAFKASSKLVEDWVQNTNKAFDVDNLVEYSQKVSSANDAFDSLNEELKTFIASGETQTYGAAFQLSDMRKAAIDYADALEELGYVNEDTISKLREIGEGGYFGNLDANAEIEAIREEIRTAAMGFSEEAATLLSLGDEDIQRINSSWQYSTELVEETGQRYIDIAALAGKSSNERFAEELDASNYLVDEATGRVFDRVSLTWSDMEDTASYAGSDTVVGFVSGLESNESILVTAGGNFVDTVTGAILPISKEMRSKAVDAVTGMALEFNSDGTVKRAVSDLVQNATSESNVKAATSGSNIGYNIASGMTEGLRKGESSFLSRIKSFASNALDMVSNLFGIHSPARAFADITQWIPPGMAQGIERTESVAYRAMENVAAGMLSEMNGVSVDMSSIIDTSKFSDKFSVALSETAAFLTGVESQFNSAALSPSFSVSTSAKQAELLATSNQSRVTTSNLSELFAALSSRAANGVASAREVVCNLILDGNKMATFVIDTVTGHAVQTGVY